MTCATCGTVGPAEAAWCPACYLPYVRVSSFPPPVPQQAQPQQTPWQQTQSQQVPVYGAPSGYPPPPYAPAAYAPAAYAPAAYPPAYAPSPFAAPPQPGPPGFSQPQFQQFAPQAWPEKLGLVIPEYALNTGDVPRICVVSGRPTENMVRLRWTWSPGWTYLLGLLIRYFLSDRVAGYLPIHPEVRRRRRLRLALSGVLFFAGWVLTVVGAASGLAVVVVGGVLLWIASPVLALRSATLVPAKRAAPGFIALPKASAEFRAAFNAGRPAGQVPYSSTPAKFQTSTVMRVLGGICLLFVGFGFVTAFHQGVSCRSSAIHPNVGAIHDAFARSRTEIVRINAETAGQGLTQATAQELVAEHQRLAYELQSVPLNAADEYAVSAYVAGLTAYDTRLLRAMQGGADADAMLQSANAVLDANAASLNDALTAKPERCTS